MQSDKKYLEWCAKQKKGIKVVKESENLQKAYVKKSKEALKSMEVNANAGIDEWAVSASYYAKYFIIYALLSRMGIKCEIHDCTIALFIYYLEMIFRNSFCKI
ncbi:MAG TPA: HEPN domain-containing protein [Candidatus Nitrosotalea sp.]|nr:HEPN domain-containing protein [Candidatus Nitrosotalea sp.]